MIRKKWVEICSIVIRLQLEGREVCRVVIARDLREEVYKLMIDLSSITNLNFDKIAGSLILANFSSLYFVKATKAEV